MLRNLFLGAFTLILMNLNVSGQTLPLDSSWALNGKFYVDFNSGNDTPTDILKLANGDYFIVGSSYRSSFNDYHVGLAKVKANGLPVQAFGDSGKVAFKYNARSNANGIALQSDDKILLCGSTNTSNGVSGIRPALYRLEATGQIDTTFAVNGQSEVFFPGNSAGELFDVQVLGDGKILTYGLKYRNGFALAIRRYNTDGTIDVSFDGDGQVIYPVSSLGFYKGAGGFMTSDSSLIVYANVVAGSPASLKVGIAKFNYDGTLDTNFATQGIYYSQEDMVSGSGQHLEVLEDDLGRFVYATTFFDSLNQAGFGVARLNNDGSYDNSFGTNGKVIHSIGTAGAVFGFNFSSDGGILVNGRINSGTFQGLVLKLNPNGLLDNSFHSNGIFIANWNGNSGTHWVLQSEDIHSDTLLVYGYDFALGGDLVLVKFAPYSPVSSIAEYNSNVNVNVFPNPVSEQLIISSDEGLSRIILQDIKGAIIKDKYYNSSDLDYIIDLAAFENGIYLVTVVDKKGKMRSKKIAVQH